VVNSNVLVTGAGSILGQGIIKSLKLANNQHSGSVKYRIFSADMSPQAAGLYRCYKAFLIPAPSSDEYAEQIIQICKENDIDAVFVGTDEELMPLAALKDRIEKESDATLITNPENVIKIASDKWATYEYLEKNKIPCAKSVLPEDSHEFIGEFGFPIVVKPREGHGSLHFYIVNNYDELKQVISFIEMVGWRPILQEYLEGNNEFTSGITIDKSGKKVMSTISMRKIIKNGQTYKAFIDDFDPVRRSAQEVARKIGANGAINIQAKMVDDKHKVFEINARFSATCPLRAVAGINEPDIVYRNVLLDEEIKIDSYQKLVCMRYWNEVYVPMPAYEKFRAKKIIQDTDSFIPHYF
jgi:carbamoyl-phosphate synthase large subunit